MFCNFILIDGLYKCTKCGIEIYTNDEQLPIFPCSIPEISSDMPDFIDRIKGFTGIELLNQTSDDGMASNELIESRFRICETCEFFQNKTCSQCGCVINRVRNHMNKLSLANEECPIKRW